MRDHANLPCFTVGTLVLLLRAQGSLGESIRYSLELSPTDQGVFVVDTVSGELTVSVNGTDRLVVQVSTCSCHN